MALTLGHSCVQSLNLYPLGRFGTFTEGGDDAVSLSAGPPGERATMYI
jgi:hypothetical protein